MALEDHLDREVNGTPIGKDQYSILLGDEKYGFIESAKPAYSKDPSMRDAKEHIRDALFSFTRHLSSDPYVAGEIEKINSWVRKINESFGYVHDVECRDQLAEEIVKRDRNTVMLRPGQSIEDALKQPKDPEKERIRYDIDEETKRNVKGNSFRIEALKAGVENTRESLRQGIRHFVENYIKIASGLYVREMDDADPEFVISVQKRFIEINNEINYLSHDNPYFEMVECKYDSETHASVSERHFKKKVRPSKTIFLERSKELENNK